MVISAMSSCINEYPVDCKISVSFDYSYNILSSDALENQIDELMLYVFDENDILIGKYSRKGENIGNTPVIEIDRPSANGNYRFAAWGRSNTVSGENADFSIPDLTVGLSNIEDLSYYLKTISGVSQYELNNFLVGMTESGINPSGKDMIRVNLKKVTKKIRVVLLPYVGSAAPDVNNYSFSIVDQAGNGHINYDYSVLGGEPVTYLPYYKANISPSSGETDRAAAVEFSTSRLIEKNAARLRITTAEGTREVVNINLPWLFSLTEMESHHQWPLQEYLDRQDEYVITLFFNDDVWMDATIIINGWVVNNININ